ncbi:MAG: hypothetical protein JSW48_13500 [Betaproteobacteria bacterium]|jgi:uncharacterized lipoprotein|nr:MAG: hypothetical protein JSW48_13500 [Betaproteobacteria bacterium]
MNTFRSAGALVATLAIVITGCALKPQSLHLDPTVEYAGEPTTSESLLGFSVTDARPTKKLGEVGDPNTELVEVSLDEDFAPLVTERMTSAIEKRGFSVVPWSPAMTRSLEVRIDSLALNSVKTPVTFETELRAEVTATASNDKQLYERVYYVRSYQETAGPPYEKHSNRLVNQAVSQALNEVLNDDKLFEILAR